jgi:thiamine-phosphate pyrophosphorylase
MFPREARIYPLTDVRVSGLSHAEQVIRLSDGGASVIQLREKHMPPREFYKQAQEALAVARKRGIRIVINDRVDMALALGADGVHLGQRDLPPEAARGLLGDKAIIGFSTHNVEQALRAARLPIDYLAIGPIFATSSKNNVDPVVGLEGLRKVRKASGSLQLVAIGGITHENAASAMEAGADAVALISALLIAPQEIIVRTKRLFAALPSL